MASPGSGWLTTSDVVAKWLKVAADAKAAENGSIAAAGFADAATTLISVFDLISGMGMRQKSKVMLSDVGMGQGVLEWACSLAAVSGRLVFSPIGCVF